MAVWIVRAESNGENEQLALDQGLTVIGWEELPDLALVRTREEMESLCRKTYSDAKPGTISAVVAQLWAFSHTIQVGELVLLPRLRPGARGTVAIGRITGPYKYCPDLPAGAYHTRPVEWIRTDVQRSAFDAELRLSLNASRTVFQIRRERAQERVLEAARGQPAVGERNGTEPEPLDLEGYAREQIRTHIARMFRTHDLARLVDALLMAEGYQTRLSPPGRDGGVDIIAGRGPMGFDPPRLCVQVKSSDQPADVHMLRELHGVMKDFGAQQGLFVSWGGFNQEVLRQERSLFFATRLWDADNLIDGLLERYDSLPADLQAQLPLKRIWALVQEES